MSWDKSRNIMYSSGELKRRYQKKSERNELSSWPMRSSNAWNNKCLVIEKRKRDDDYGELYSTHASSHLTPHSPSILLSELYPADGAKAHGEEETACPYAGDDKTNREEGEVHSWENEWSNSSDGGGGGGRCGIGVLSHGGLIGEDSVYEGCSLG